MDETLTFSKLLTIEKEGFTCSPLSLLVYGLSDYWVLLPLTWKQEQCFAKYTAVLKLTLK